MKTDKQVFVIKIAKSCFYHWGIHNVSIDEIAKECGVSKKTVYTFFDSRSDLVKAVFLQEFQSFESSVKSITLGAKNAITELTVFFSSFYRINVPPIVIHDLRKYYPDLYTHLLKLGEQLIEVFILANIQRGIRESVYKPSAQIERHLRPLIKLVKVAVLDEEGQDVLRSGSIEFMGQLLLDHLIVKENSAKE